MKEYAFVYHTELREKEKGVLGFLELGFKFEDFGRIKRRV